MYSLNKMREEMSQKFLAALKENKIPWEMEWLNMGRPVNPVSNTTYRGANSLWLSAAAEEKGYKDPRFMTFKQATDKGWHVKKGEKGFPIEFWSMYDTLTKRKLSRTEFYLISKAMEEKGEDWSEQIKPMSSVYTVFNAEQIEGIPKLTDGNFIPDKDLMAKRDRLIFEMGVGFSQGHEGASYSSKLDEIKMPDPERFKNEYAYMATFLHEAGHATGAEHRMNRNLQNAFGTKEYAKEELRAEIASAFTAQAIGLGGEDKLQNHKAYIQNWIDIIEEKPSELFAAIKDAERISDYLIEKGGFEVINNLEAASEKETDAKTAEDPEPKNTVVINAFGGAGAGKTTACLHIVAELKKQGFVAEYVSEYAKELVWDKNYELLDGSMESQSVILKEQNHRVERLTGQVDFVVTDSPILLNGIYLKDCPDKEAYCEKLLEKFNSYTNFNLVIQRDPKKYEPEGRLQSLEESIVIDNDITEMLKKNNIYFGTYDHSKLDVIVNNAVRTLKKAVRTNDEKDAHTEAQTEKRNPKKANRSRPSGQELLM